MKIVPIVLVVKCNNKNIFIALSGPPPPSRTPYRSAHVICPWVFNSDTLSLITIIQIATTMTLFNYLKKTDCFNSLKNKQILLLGVFFWGGGSCYHSFYLCK